MSPALITLLLSLIEEAINLEPAIAADLQAIFANQNPTPADWEALRAKVLAKTYANYVPASALPAASAAAASPPLTTSAPQSNAPISQPSASVAIENASATAGTAIPAYLPDGSKNPAYQE